MTNETLICDRLKHQKKYLKVTFVIRVYILTRATLDQCLRRSISITPDPYWTIYQRLCRITMHKLCNDTSVPCFELSDVIISLHNKTLAFPLPQLLVSLSFLFVQLCRDPSFLVLPFLLFTQLIHIRDDVFQRWRHEISDTYKLYISPYIWKQRFCLYDVHTF